MKSYKDLEIYKLSYDLAIRIHKMSLKLSKYEMYEEGSQIRKSSKSISSCIVEGYVRNLGKYRSRISCSIVQRFCVMFFSVVLLVLGQQDVSFAADEPNQSTQSGEKQGPDGRPQIAKIIESDLPAQEIINRIIQILDKEPVELSLSRLDEIKMYIWPGWVLTMDGEDLDLILRIPLDASVGQRDIVAIMGNRRFLKVIHELSLLPKEKAAALVSKQISSSLSQYKRLFDSYMKQHKKTLHYNLNKPHGERTKSLGFVFSTRDGIPTLLAVRFKVLALVLIAGNLQLQQAQPAVSKVLEIAIEQRDMFYAKDAFYKRDAAFMLYEGSLYNRQIVGTAVIGTYISSDKVGRVLKDLDCKLKSETLTHYNAVATPYDLHTLEKTVPIDYSKGELTVKYLEPLNDSKFDDIVNAASKARQQNTMPKEPKE